MCGRFTLIHDLQTILDRFGIDYVAVEDYSARYNIAPSQDVIAIISDGKNRLGTMRWGLIPRWARDKKIGYKMMNARGETVAKKPSFKHPFKRQRCIIPCDGFYEWKKTEDEKQPYRIRLKSGELFGFAGLWDRWEHDGEEIFSFTIITTSPNSLMSEIHDRMPVILSKENEKRWLDHSIEDPYILQDLLHSYPAEEMEAYKVPKIVNSPKNEDKACIEPLRV